MAEAQPVISPDRAHTLARWLATWTGIGIALVLVVAGFLIAIVIALFNVSSNLGATRSEVVGVEANVDPLPHYITAINRSLGAVSHSVRPLPGQAAAIEGNLGVINRTLGHVDGRLRSTSAPLSDTASVLRNTTGTLSTTSVSLGRIAATLQQTVGPLGQVEGRLVSTRGSLGSTLAPLRSTAATLADVRALAVQIHRVLVLAERPSSLGTAAIYMRVAIANGALDPAERDARGILHQLQDVEQHLVSICRSATVSTVGATHGATRC